MKSTESGRKAFPGRQTEGPIIAGLRQWLNLDNLRDGPDGTGPGPGFLKQIAAMFFSGFFLMASYGVARPSANSLYSQLIGAENMYWAMALMPVMVTLVILPYGRSLTYLGPRLTLVISVLISMSLLILPPLFPSAALAFILYLGKEAYVVVLVEQYWALVSSSVTIKASKRFNGILLIGGGIGGVTGNLLVKLLVTDLGTWDMLFIAAGLLIPFAWTMDLAFRFAGNIRGLSSINARPDRAGATDHSGWKFLRSSRYLLLLAVIIAMGQIFSSVMDVEFHIHLQEAYPDMNVRSELEATFWAAVNGSTLILNLLAPLIFAWLSIRTIHYIFPISHLITAGVYLLFPGTWTAAASLLWFKVVDYSLFRTSKEVLYIPLPFDARYRTKMIIDLAVYRISKGSAALAFAATGAAHLLGGMLLPMVALGAAGAWFFCVPTITREFERVRDKLG